MGRGECPALEKCERMRKFMEKMRFEIREVDAWAGDDGDWTWNTSYYLGTMTTKAENVKRAFVRYLKSRRGIVFRRGRTAVIDCCGVIEIRDRRTGEPLFAALFLD